MVEIWLRYEPIGASHYVTICTYPIGVLWPCSRFGMHVAVQHSITQPQKTLERKGASATTILSRRIFSVFIPIFPAFIGPNSEKKVFFPPLIC